ncbi:hypothetical protein BOS5A_110660 [Bosea sp. EC-HK365B]|nr:hypothetical protein BOSE21B_110050 [Bosea sp. 21B]CAD5283871.1 hypothetical protein BOSE7B_41164 [Bosea sp. 7B]VVT52311.1 hypothetical protein BOS5A_110660 [Bosea sp. EC-HK365B]VXC90410.1 hypothetical protein BOSE127_70209 [Bosea sp. 127]
MGLAAAGADAGARRAVQAGGLRESGRGFCRVRQADDLILAFRPNEKGPLARPLASRHASRGSLRQPCAARTRP